MNIYRFFTAVCLGLIVQCNAAMLYASSEGGRATSNAARALASLLSSAQHYRASFSQSTVDPEGALVDRYEGWVAISQPSSMRWEINSPIEQQLIVQDKKYYQFDRDIDQLVIGEVSGEVALLSTVFFASDPDVLAGMYAIEMLPVAEIAPQLQRFELRSSREQSLFRKLVLVFDNKLLKAIEIYDDLEQTTTIELMDIDLSELSADVFSVDVPPSTEIVHQ